jgi:hypothetical protein
MYDRHGCTLQSQPLVYDVMAGCLERVLLLMIYDWQRSKTRKKCIYFATRSSISVEIIIHKIRTRNTFKKEGELQL